MNVIKFAHIWLWILMGISYVQTILPPLTIKMICIAFRVLYHYYIKIMVGKPLPGKTKSIGARTGPTGLDIWEGISVVTRNAVVCENTGYTLRSTIANKPIKKLDDKNTVKMFLKRLI